MGLPFEWTKKRGAAQASDQASEEFIVTKAGTPPVRITNKEKRRLLKEEVRKIIDGKNLKTAVTRNDITVAKGDRFELDNNYWVQVMNLEDISSSNHTFIFQDVGDLENARVAAGGTIMIMGFTDDSQRALVEYSLPPNKTDGGTAAPSGTQFFIKVRDLLVMKN